MQARKRSRARTEDGPRRFTPISTRPPTATRTFQRLQDAYTVLADPETRAAYDTSVIGDDRGADFEEAGANPSRSRPEPLRCTRCNRVTAQPRYVVCYEVMSFIVITYRRWHQGIHCSRCASIRLAQASAVTWLLGWWGLPWGPIYAFYALCRNLFGGARPAEPNARILFHQAWTFAMAGQVELARAILDHAETYCDTFVLESRHRGVSGHDVDPVEERSIELQESIERFREFIGPSTGPRLRNPWRLLGPSSGIQVAMATAIVAILVSLGANGEEPTPAAPSKTETSGTVSTPTAAVPTSKYVTPTLAPNGRAWPVVAAYLRGYPILARGGHCRVTISNSGSSSAVHCKLVLHAEQFTQTVRQVYLPAHSSLALAELIPGRYRLRILEIDTGQCEETEAFELEQRIVGDDVYFSDMSISLGKRIGGNFETSAISPQSFGEDER